MNEVRAIYQRWRDGEISQEDALFEIGDALDIMPATDALTADVQTASGELLAVSR
jgi:hypothetical protein